PSMHFAVDAVTTHLALNQLDGAVRRTGIDDHVVVDVVLHRREEPRQHRGLVLDDHVEADIGFRPSHVPSGKWFGLDVSRRVDPRDPKGARSARLGTSAEQLRAARCMGFSASGAELRPYCCFPPPADPRIVRGHSPLGRTSSSSPRAPTRVALGLLTSHGFVLLGLGPASHGKARLPPTALSTFGFEALLE